MSKPYSGTSVTVEDSQMDIEKLLHKYNAEKIYFAYERLEILLTFTLRILGDQHLLVFRVPVDSPLQKGKKQNARKIKEKQKRNEQAAWRALFWTLKSLLETLQLKIQISHEVFTHTEKIA